MINNSDQYALKAFNQIPRILSNMDRNEFSKTYGCLHRDYWLYKTSDFSDAVRQFSSQALALVYDNNFIENIYYKNKKVGEWAKASLLYWCKIQHKDGSFDEFYPNERGWVGPTAFTAFSSAESFKILQPLFNKDEKTLVKNALLKSAYFIGKGESEEDHLANHHAMACLAVWKIYKLFNDEKLLVIYNRLWKGFITYCDMKEGWAREYDGIDPGYLSATVSFLGKIYEDNGDQEILEICKKFINTCSYFVYPNGFYAGTTGSRNTLHLYTHGFEIFSKESDISAAIADKMLLSIKENKLVTPEIMSDRYVGYRIPEYLQSYLSYKKRNKINSQIPCELPYLTKYFKNAGIWIYGNENVYVISNLAKGGALKIFNKKSRALLYDDAGLLVETNDGNIISSQWIDSEYKLNTSENSYSVLGNLNVVPSNKYFNVIKLIVFRTFLLFFGWNSFFAHKIKGTIRKILMLGNRRSPMSFKRELKIENQSITITNSVKKNKSLRLKKMMFGDNFSVGYVPQSRYFQSQELSLEKYILDSKELNLLNEKNSWSKSIKIEIGNF